MEMEGGSGSGGGGGTEGGPPPGVSTPRPRRTSTTTGTIMTEAEAAGHLLSLKADHVRNSAYKRKGGRGGQGQGQGQSTSNSAYNKAKKQRMALNSGRKPTAAAGKPPTGSNEVIDLEEEYQVEAILDKKFGQGGQLLYFIKWKGWPVSANTWEPLGNLSGCEEEVKEFEVRWLQRQNEKNQGGGAGPSGVNRAVVSGTPKTEKSVASTSGGAYKAVVSAPATTTPASTPTTAPQSTPKPDDEEEDELMAYDILNKCPANKIPKELVGVIEIDGCLTYLIEWEHQKENQNQGGVGGGEIVGAEPDRRLIKSLPFKTMYPTMVIRYYENHINFTNANPHLDILGQRPMQI